MKNKILGVLFLTALVIILLVVLFPRAISLNQIQSMKQEIILSSPNATSNTSIEEALFKRRSIREYKDEPLELKEISQILWASQGITEPERGGRTAPSAGALYPLEVYVVVRKAEGLEPGVYHYVPKEHKLEKILEGDLSAQLARAALGQVSVKEAAVNMVISAVYGRTTKKYGERGVRYAHLEAGHAAQNVYLQAESLDLGTVTVGAFSDEEVKNLLHLPEEETPLYIMPIGKPR